MITKIIQSLWYKVSSATLALATAVHYGQVHTSFFGTPWTSRCQALEYKTTSYETGPLIEPQILAPRPPDSVSHTWAQRYLPFYKRSGWLWYAWSTPHSQKTVLDSIQLSMFCISRKQSSLLFGGSSQDGPPSAWAANCGHSAATWCPESQVCSIWVQTERTPQHDKWPRCMRPREKQAFRWGEMSMCDVLSYTYTHTCAQEWDASLTWVHFKHGVLLMMEETGEQWRQLRMTRALISGHQAPATSWGESRLSISASHTFRKAGLWETILENRLGKEAAIPLHLSSLPFAVTAWKAVLTHCTLPGFLSGKPRGVPSPLCPEERGDTKEHKGKHECPVGKREWCELGDWCRVRRNTGNFLPPSPLTGNCCGSWFSPSF